jgi:hypothetical protein
MTRKRPILIACPQCRKLVRGSYECDESGEYRLGPDKGFLLSHARCEQDGGRCAQTLCVLHRYNGRGPDSWYPDRILAMPAAGSAPANPPPPSRPAPDEGGIELLR